MEEPPAASKADNILRSDIWFAGPHARNFHPRGYERATV